MKIIKKLPAFFVILTIISCSTDVIDSKQTSLEANNTYKVGSYDDNAKYIYHAIDLINEDFDTNGVPGTLDENQLSYYESLVNYQSDLSLEYVDEVLEKSQEAFDEGVQSFLVQYNYSTYTNDILVKNSQGAYVKNLDKTFEFQFLNDYEKKLLLQTNAIAGNLEQKNFWGAFGAVVGLIVGTAICGPLCGVGAAIVTGVAANGAAKK